jgi:DNA ligase D-like protein (predicted ligase)
MLATLTPEPFDSPEFRFELKWDGVRCVAFLESSTRLQSRRLNDLTSRYPELAGLHGAVSGRPAILDGELVLFSEGRPDFTALLARHQLRTPARLLAAAQSRPVTYVAFDLLYWEGRNIMDYPLHRRQELLREAVQETDRLVLSRPVAGSGLAFARAVFARGLEGVLAKRSDSPYRPGIRSRDWLKVKRPRSLRAVIAGYAERVDGGVGSVVAGVYDETGTLRLAGQAGVSLPESASRDLLQRLTALRGTEPPLVAPLSRRLRSVRWVEPRLVCRLEYLEQGAPGHLRHAVFRELLAGDPQCCTSAQLVVDHPRRGGGTA